MIKSICVDLDNSRKCDINNKPRVSSSFHSIYKNDSSQEFFTHNHELLMVTNIYNNIHFDYEKKLKSDITKKMHSYIHQDKTKNIYDSTKSINFDKIIECPNPEIGQLF